MTNVQLKAETGWTRRAVVLLALALCFSWGWAQGDDIDCANYGRLAVAQNEENRAQGLGLSGPLWSSDYGYHFGWCMGVSGAQAEAGTVRRAQALRERGGDPRCTFMLDVALRVTAISVEDEADGPGDAEPYLFPLFFKLDGDTVTFLSTPWGRWIHAPGGGHGNLGEDWDTGDVIPVPDALGSWRVTLRGGTLPDGRPLPEQAIAVGMLMILLEEDANPSSGAVAGFYREMVDLLAARLGSAVAVAWTYIDLANSASYGILARSAQEEVQRTIIDQADLPWYGYVGIALAPWLAPVGNIDDFIGADVSIWTWDDLVAQPYRSFSRRWNEASGSEDGDFTLYGEVRSSSVGCR